MSVFLRPATAADLEILRIIRNSCREFMEDRMLISPEHQQAWWDRVCDRDDFHAYVVEWDEKVGHGFQTVVCGYGIVRKEEGRWWLTGGLLPSYRDQGLGALLFSELMDTVQAPWLRVRAGNKRARRLYERLGFEYVCLSRVSDDPEGVWTMRKPPTLQDVETIAGAILNDEARALDPALVDARPAWLRALPDACNPKTPYYRLFHMIARIWQPINVLEIGTDKAVASAHFALGHPANRVVTIDNNPTCQEIADGYGLPNLVAVFGNSAVAVDYPEVVHHAPYDILFIDGNHTYNQAKGEFELYRPLLAPGALVFFDDIELEMEGDEMRRFWSEIQEPKRVLPGMHDTGLGVVQV